MDIHLFHPAVLPPGIYPERIRADLNCLARETDTGNLVTAVYLVQDKRHSFGTAYTKIFNPHMFSATRGKWKFTSQYTLPSSLPSRYRLIRICLGLPAAFPAEEQDIYGWKLRYSSLYDKLAFIFAHELHHFRRYHLGLHPREGEHSANRWALNRAAECGFSVKGERCKQQRPKRRAVHRLPSMDKYKEFRHLKQNARVKITIDPKRRYINREAVVVRPIRTNSKRIVIQTPDGRQWRWPMEWCSPVE